MPTARELLEQADALMRRNRARDQAPPVPAGPAPVIDDEVPELTEVAALAEASALAEPAKLAEGAAETPEAVAPTALLAPGDGEPPEASADGGLPDAVPPPASPPEVASPVLREALARELASPVAAYPPPMPVVPQVLDDIPELTEVVEEIEAPSILDATGDIDMGEPSVWMEPGHGEVSILRRWPEVPDGAAGVGDARIAAERSVVDDTEVGVLHVAPELLDAELAAALPSDDVLARSRLEVVPRESVVQLATADAPAEVVIVTEDAEALSQDGGEVAAMPVADEVAATPVADEVAATPVADEVAAMPLADEAAATPTGDEAAKVDQAAEEIESESATDGQALAGEAPMEAGRVPVVAAGATAAAAIASLARSAVPFEEQAEVAEASTAAPADLAAETDAERWDRLAEEVRMQVLQRIDIFTDTGLQEQLARRLQPMVDRASADLVATINHHVGALMRAYVAEAIEREIEKWRAGGR